MRMPSEAKAEGEMRMKITLNPSKTKFYNLLKSTPEVKELPSIRNMHFCTMGKDCKMSFYDWDKQKEGEYKLMAVAGRPRLIIEERVFGEEGKEQIIPISIERLECFGLISRTEPIV